MTPEEILTHIFDNPVTIKICDKVQFWLAIVFIGWIIYCILRYGGPNMKSVIILFVAFCIILSGCSPYKKVGNWYFKREIIEQVYIVPSIIEGKEKWRIWINVESTDYVFDSYEEAQEFVERNLIR